MKRRIKSSILLILIALFLLACMKQDNLKETNEKGTKSVSEHGAVILETVENDVDYLTKYQEVTLPGQAGIISIQIPEGWQSISFPATEDKGSYRIRFYPEKVEKGYIAYEGKNKGLYANTFYVDEWWDEYGAQVMKILSTASIKIEYQSGRNNMIYAHFIINPVI